MPDTPGKRQRREVQARRRMEKSAKRVARRAQRLDPNYQPEIRPSDEGGYRFDGDTGHGEAQPEDHRGPHTEEDEQGAHPDPEERNPQSNETS
jgi:hypothetical protein